MINTLKKLSEINKIGIGLDYFLFKNLRLLIESKDSVVARNFNILENNEKINKIENLFLGMSLDEQKEAIKIIYIGFLSESFNNPFDDYGFFDPKFKKDFIKLIDENVKWKNGETFCKKWFEIYDSYIEDKECFNFDFSADFYVVLLKTLISEKNNHAKYLIDDLPSLDKKSFRLFFDSQPETIALMRLSMSRAFHYTEQKINNHVSKLFLSSNSVTESKVFYEQEILLFINKIKNKPYVDDFSQFVESIASFEAINFPSGIVKEFFMLSNYFYDDCMSFFNDISKKMEIDDKLGALIIFLLNFERMENEDNNNSKEVASSQLLKIFKNNAFEKLLDEMIALKDIGEDKIKIEVRSDSFYAVFKLLEESKNQRVYFLRDSLKKYEKGLFSSIEVRDKETTEYLNSYGWQIFLEKSLILLLSKMNEKETILNVEITKNEDSRCLNICLSELSKEEKDALLSRNFKNNLSLACLNLNGTIYSKVSDVDGDEVFRLGEKCLDEHLSHFFEKMNMKKNNKDINISNRMKKLRKF